MNGSGQTISCGIPVVQTPGCDSLSLVHKAIALPNCDFSQAMPLSMCRTQHPFLSKQAVPRNVLIHSPYHKRESALQTSSASQCADPFNHTTSVRDHRTMFSLLPREHINHEADSSVKRLRSLSEIEVLTRFFSQILRDAPASQGIWLLEKNSLVGISTRTKQSQHHLGVSYQYIGWIAMDHSY